MTNKKDITPFLASNALSPTKTNRSISSVLGNPNNRVNESFKLPVYEDDCVNIDICPQIYEKCRSGANPLLCERCTPYQINQLQLQHSKPQTISVNGSQNVNIGDGNVIQITNVKELPGDLVDEFRALIKSNPKDKRGFLKWLEKFNTVGGTVKLLIDLVKLCCGI